MDMKQSNPFISDYVYDNGRRLESEPRNVRFVHELKTIKNSKYKKFLIIAAAGVLLAAGGLAAGIYGFLEIAKNKAAVVDRIEGNLDNIIADGFQKNLEKINEGVNSPLSPYSSAIVVNDVNTPWLQTSDEVGYDDLGTGATSDKYVVTKRVLDEKAKKYALITSLDVNGETLDWLSLDIGNQDPETTYSSLPSFAVLTKGLAESRLNALQTGLSAAEISLSSLTTRVDNDETILSTLSSRLTNDYMLTTDINTELAKKADVATTYTKDEIDSLIDALKTQVISKTFEASRDTRRKYRAASNVNYTNSSWTGFGTSATTVSFNGTNSYSEYFGLSSSKFQEIKTELRNATSNANKPKIRFYVQDKRINVSDVATTEWFTIDTLNNTVVLSKLRNRNVEVKVTLNTSQTNWTIKVTSEEKNSSGRVIATNSGISIYAFDIKYGQYDGVLAYSLSKEVYSAREVDELLRQVVKDITANWETKNNNLVARVNSLVNSYNTLLRG